MFNLKKMLLAVTAAALLVTSIVSPVCAADAVPDNLIDPGHQTSLTIYKYDQTAAELAGVNLKQFIADGEKDTAAEAALANYALKGVEFAYVKAGNFHTCSEAGELKLMYDLPDGLKTILGMTNPTVVDGVETYTSDAINTALAAALRNNTTTKNSLEAFVKNGTKMSLTNEQGMTSATSMGQGLYLLVETRVPEEVHTTTDPFFVSLPMTDPTGDHWNYDVTVYPKNQTNNPTIDKLVSANGGAFADITTASEGDVLSYRLVSKLPTITSTTTYLSKYTFVDTLSKGIKYNKDAAIEIYNAENDARNGTGTPVKWDAKNFNVSYNDAENKMTVAMTADGLADINAHRTDKFLVVTYKATVQSNADVVLGDTGNPNDVALTYSRTNEVEENTIEDKANVFSYGIDLTKTFNGNAGDATAVRFVLQNEGTGMYLTATGSNGVYYVTDSAPSKTVEKATEFAPNANGKLIINGLEAATYRMDEIKTDGGFSLLKDPIYITFNGTVDDIEPSVATITGIQNPNDHVIVTNGNRASATVDGKAANMVNDNASTNARVVASIINTRSFTLPQTGGLGTILFTLAGATAVIIGFLVVTKGKKAEK